MVIRPATFTEKRVSDISALHHILEKTSVERRVWGFPQLHNLTQPDTGPEWIGQETDWRQHVEVWRFYQSGQFVYYSGMVEDWKEQITLWPLPNGGQPGLALGIGDVLSRFTEIFEFASRLTFTEAGDEQMHLEVTVKGIEGRTLQLDLPGRTGFLLERKATISEQPYKADLSRVELVTDTRELALKPAAELFQHFGWKPGISLLRDIQSELIR